jgi:hypothetical protein
MTPEELHKMTIDQLGEIRIAMAKPEYRLGIDNLLPAKQAAAAAIEDMVQTGWLEMKNAQLGDILEKLNENERDIDKGIKSVKTALGDLKKVENVLSAVGSFLKIVGRIVSLV